MSWPRTLDGNAWIAASSKGTERGNLWASCRLSVMILDPILGSLLLRTILAIRGRSIPKKERSGGEDTHNPTITSAMGGTADATGVSTCIHYLLWTPESAPGESV